MPRYRVGKPSSRTSCCSSSHVLVALRCSGFSTDISATNRFDKSVGGPRNPRDFKMYVSTLQTVSGRVQRIESAHRHQATLYARIGNVHNQLQIRNNQDAIKTLTHAPAIAWVSDSYVKTAPSPFDCPAILLSGGGGRLCKAQRIYTQFKLCTGSINRLSPQLQTKQTRRMCLCF